MNNVDPADTTLPIACTLGAGEGAERLRRWEALGVRGRPIARLSGHLLEVRYSPAAAVESELNALAAAEQQCCSFVTWTVGVEEDDVVLRVAADPERPDEIAGIAALFGATR